MRVKLSNFLTQDIAAGAGTGRAVLAQLISRAPNGNGDPVVFLDLSGVRVATASFLREAVLGFRAYVARTGRSVIPVNIEENVLEELADLLASLQEAIVVARLENNDTVLDAQVIGYLDERQVETLVAVLAAGETDAGSLKSREDRGIGTTGWNNRLSALAAKGILAERKVGRAKRYRAIVEPLRYGH